MVENTNKKIIDWSKISQEWEELLTYFEEGFYNMTIKYTKKE